MQLDAAPFVEHIERLKMDYTGMKNVGLDSSHFKRLKSGKQLTISLSLADKVLTATGITLEAVYPVDQLPAAEEVRALCHQCGGRSYFRKNNDLWECEVCGNAKRRRPFSREDARTIPQQAIREYFDNHDTSVRLLAEKYNCTYSGLWERIKAESLPRRPQGGNQHNLNPEMVRKIGFAGIAKRANEMREQGMMWKDIATELGYGSDIQAIKSARRWREGKYKMQRRRPK